MYTKSKFKFFKRGKPYSQKNTFIVDYDKICIKFLNLLFKVSNSLLGKHLILSSDLYFDSK